ncbi:mechanosensitive ion channel family protein [Streptomyces sp. RB6PN25]|uniref:Mechanosensitive ion channel family protein n=1 Tax=Streptomyces humicola TaxID=2953240 RepID=A0ABT1PW32_9ACTN|nr:mechanosensitive ion channel family protein [Streptomyces humicola]MCQ4081876.1 mechanosensitive ion channel family protein [Streptomyces humicola]
MTRATQSANGLASYVENHWVNWLSTGIEILIILAIAVVLRAVVRRMITQLIARMNRGAEASAQGGALGGLLVNAERRRQRSEAIGSVLRSVASFVILGTAALMVLSSLHIDLAPLLASAGVAGVAVGFGARNLVTDFLSGVFMILEDQYGVGDVIDAGVATGTVIEVGLRVTKLRGDNGEIWYVRNGEVKRIGNLSQGWSTAVVDVQVGYGEDLDRARALIAATAEDMAKDEPWDETLWEPVQVLGLEEVSPESVVIRAQAKTMPGKAAGVARELRWRIKKSFDEAGIGFLGGTPEQIPQDAADAAASVAPPSALANPSSPQASRATPLPTGEPSGPHLQK